MKDTKKGPSVFWFFVGSVDILLNGLTCPTVWGCVCVCSSTKSELVKMILKIVFDTILNDAFLWSIIL